MPASIRNFKDASLLAVAAFPAASNLSCLLLSNKSIFYLLILIIQVSQITSGPRRGPTFNNRWWNDRRSWNLRTTNSREKASPKGANHIQSCSCSPPSGTIENMSAIRRFHSLRSFHPRLFTFAPFGDGRMLFCETLVKYKKASVSDKR